MFYSLLFALLCVTGALGAIQIACVGDSITAGSCSSCTAHTYPSQLQDLLDQTHGSGKFQVTNLGESGSTMLKNGDSPYWQRGSYQTLVKGVWDIVVIMLGTNDAKDQGSGGPPNWTHECGGAEHTTLEGCSFAADYASMLDVVSGLGQNGTSPLLYTAIPPPLMQQGAIGANQTVINSVYPKLVPMIAANYTSPPKVIDLFTGMGGVSDWQSEFPAECAIASPWKPCTWWCDDQHCDQCHPNDNGYAHMAKVFQMGLGL